MKLDIEIQHNGTKHNNLVGFDLSELYTLSIMSYTNEIYIYER
jgi:hypothetical protein